MGPDLVCIGEMGWILQKYKILKELIKMGKVK